MRIITYLILILCTSTYGQSSVDRLQLRISDITTTSASVPKIAFQLECKNMTDSTYLLYGIKGSFRVIPLKIESTCEYLEKMNAGNAEYIYNDAMEGLGRNTLDRVREFHITPMTQERLDSILVASKAKYLEATAVINGNQSICFKKEIDLKEYELSKGTYYLQIVYFSGDKLYNSIDPEQVMKDKVNYKATVFKGCITSNIIKFEIN